MMLVKIKSCILPMGWNMPCRTGSITRKFFRFSWNILIIQRWRKNICFNAWLRMKIPNVSSLLQIRVGSNAHSCAMRWYSTPQRITRRNVQHFCWIIKTARRTLLRRQRGQSERWDVSWMPTPIPWPSSRKRGLFERRRMEHWWSLDTRAAAQRLRCQRWSENAE